MPDNQRPDAGWYDDPEGVPNRLRYWDGIRWTEHYGSTTPASPSVSSVSNAHTAPAVSSVSGTPAHDDAGERALAIIPNAKLKSGFMGVTSRRHTLILTDRRVIFAQSTSIGTMKRRSASTRDGAESEEGLLFRTVAGLDGYLEWAESYLETSPEDALAETKGNFAIERSGITKTSLKKKKRRMRDETGVIVDIFELLVIKAHGKKYEITLGSGVRQAKQALKAAGMR